MIIIYALTGILCVIGAYLLAVTLASWLRPPLPGAGAPARSMLFIIPARDEETGIARAIRSIKNDVADGVHTSIAVIADNCADATADVASGEGVAVFARRDPARPGKGQALHWFLTLHAEYVAAHDVAVVVDADSITAPGFQAAMARLFADPEVQAAQGFYDVANPESGWRVRLLSVALRALHHTRPLGRVRMGGSAGLKGNGMAFRTSLLVRYGWPAGSVVEDLEFSLMLVQDGVRVHYAPEATVAGDMPSSRVNAAAQRVRWEGGRLRMVRAWLPRLLRAWFRRPSLLMLDAVLDLATPPLSLLATTLLCLTGLGLAAHSAAAWFALGALGVCTAHVLCGLAQTRAPLSLWTALALAPLYVLWKLTVAAAALTRRRLVWNRSFREGARP